MANEKVQVFISGTVLDLREYRQAAIEACLRVGVVPMAMEHFGASGETVGQAVASAIDRADIYLAIIGEEYGAIFSGQGKSFTEMEYDLAGEKGIPRLVFIRSEDHPTLFGPRADDSVLRLQAFKRVVRQSGLVSEFRSVDEFKAQVVTALVDVVRSLSRESEPKSVLLLVPFGERWEHLRHFLTTTLERGGMRAYRLDQISAGALWANALTDALRKADIVIADVTDGNPNVMYELGYAHSLRKPTIILAEFSSMHSVPFDLRGYNLLTYDRNDLHSFGKQLARFLREYTKEEWRR